MFVKQFLRYWANAFRNIRYYATNKGRLVALLNSKGVDKVEPFRLLKWHHGMYLFSGLYNGEEVFIKLSVNKGELENESRAYDVLGRDDCLKAHLIKRLGYFTAEEYEVLILEKVGGQVLNPEMLLTNFNYLSSLMEIFQRMKYLGLVHRDIKWDNFMVDDGRIKIFDFTFMVSKSQEHPDFKEIDLSTKANILKLVDLGHFKPAVFVWDDYYALWCLLQEVYGDKSRLSQEEVSLLEQWILECKNNIGANSYSILHSSGVN